MSTYPFHGMRGPGQWTDDAEPGNWREKILELFPNGSVAITAMTGMIGREEFIDSERHDWKTRTLAGQAGAVTNIYVDSNISTAYVYATHQATFGVANATVFCKVALATAKEFRVGHSCTLRDSDRYDVDVFGKVVEVQHNGANSIISVRLLEADDNSSDSDNYNLATVDRILVGGNINAQGGTTPDRVTYDPEDVYNLSEIWRTPMVLARTALKTRLRGRDAQLDEQEQTLLYHGIEMEKSLIWSIRSQNTAANGNNENTIMGLNQFINTYASANVDSFKYNTTYSGKTWLESGEDWMDDMLMNIFSVGTGDLGGEVFGMCGAGAALGIKRLAKSGSFISFESAQMSYGIKVVRWETIFGTINLKIHPLFNQETTNKYKMLIFSPSYVRWLPIEDSDTDFYEDDSIAKKRGAFRRVDGICNEYLTEGTYEYNLQGPFGFLHDVGLDNAV